MIARRVILAVGFALALTPLASDARASTLDPSTADSMVERARAEGVDAFCKTPERPLSPRARALCPLAKDVAGCEGYAKACKEESLGEPEEKPSIDLGLGGVLSVIANVLVWSFVAAAVIAIVVLIVGALLRARRDRQLAEPDAAPAVVVGEPIAEALETATDAELLLRRAEDHARRGELDRAAVLYLAAALRALDRRGAIRIARHRTNGEYVRSCKDPEAKPSLRAIVREVDRVQYGHEPPTREAISEVASRAAALVRAAAVATMAVLLLGGCTPPGGPILRSADPAGDELFFEMLKRQGADVTRLGGSLATLPMPVAGQLSPMVVVDASRVPLEDEARAHLARWIDAGGVLLLAGNVREWPESFGAKGRAATSTEITVAIPLAGEDAESDEKADAETPAFAFHTARLAKAAGLAWPDAAERASSADHVMYAAVRVINEGIVLGLASDDLLTNAGLARPPNAAALVALIAEYGSARKIQVARPEDGIAPPSNPISALTHAGLGLALVHAAVAAALLMLAFGVRQARPRATPPPARRAWTEHIEATGGLFARARLAPHALAAYTRFVDGRLRAKMPRGVSDPAAFLALRAQSDPAHCADVWSRAIAARSADVPRGNELATLRELTALYAAADRAPTKTE